MISMSFPSLEKNTGSEGEVASPEVYVERQRKREKRGFGDSGEPSGRESERGNRAKTRMVDGQGQ